MTHVKSWSLRVIGVSKSNGQSPLSLVQISAVCNNHADPRAAGAVFGAAVQNSYNGALQVHASYAVYAETHVTEVEAQFGSLWFANCDFAAGVALVISLCFGAAVLQKEHCTKAHGLLCLLRTFAKLAQMHFWEL